MRHSVSIAFALTIALLLGGQSGAQQPPPNSPAGGTPDAVPFNIPYGMPITAEKAKQILSAAEAEAKKRNWKMNIAVVDPNGDLINFLRMDGAQVASVKISQGKARTAARYRYFGKADDLGCPVVVLFLERRNGTPRFAHSAVTACAIGVGSERDRRKRAGPLV
jgi:glc operon protein GlcG